MECFIDEHAKRVHSYVVHLMVFHLLRFAAVVLLDESHLPRTVILKEAGHRLFYLWPDRPRIYYHNINDKLMAIDLMIMNATRRLPNG